jgi:hypothetical protein
MQPFLALGIDQFLRIRDGHRYAVTAGLALGAAVCVRSTSLFVLVAIGAYLLVRDRRALALSVAGTLPPLTLLAAYNFRYFGSPFVEAHMLMGTAVAVAKTGSPELWSTPLSEGALGLLVSPARGLFVYSPILVLAFVGAWRVLRDPAWWDLVPIAVAAAVIMVLRFKWFDWWGGYSYGYRPLMDTLVPLAVLVIPALAARPFSMLGRAVVAALLLWSIAVQWIGTAYDSGGWDRGTRFQVEAPDGTTTDFDDRDAAAAFAKQQGGRITRVTYNVDDRRHRDRLWSVRLTSRARARYGVARADECGGEAEALHDDPGSSRDAREEVARPDRLEGLSSGRVGPEVRRQLLSQRQPRVARRVRAHHAAQGPHRAVHDVARAHQARPLVRGARQEGPRLSLRQGGRDARARRAVRVPP